MSVRKYLKAEAAATSFVKLHASASGCCIGLLTFCKYIFEGTVTAVTGITIKVDGSNVAVTFSSVSTPRDIRKAIQAALEANGFDPFYDDAWRGVRVTATSIIIIGEAEIVNMTIDGTPETFEARCETGAVCMLQGEAAFSTTIVVAGENVVVPASGDVAGFLTNLEAGLTTAAVSFTKTEATEDTAGYVYKIHTVGDIDIIVDGENLAKCGCYPDLLLGS